MNSLDAKTASASKPPDISLEARAAIFLIIRALKTIISILEKYLKGATIIV